MDDDAVSVYVRELIDTVPALTVEEEARLLADLRSGGEAARRAGKRLVKGNLRVVVSITRRYDRTTVDTLDLIIEGNSELLRALETFPAAQGEDFSTYAANCVEQAIKSASHPRG